VPKNYFFGNILKQRKSFWRDFIAKNIFYEVILVFGS